MWWHPAPAPLINIYVLTLLTNARKKRKFNGMFLIKCIPMMQVSVNLCKDGARPHLNGGWVANETSWVVVVKFLRPEATLFRVELLH